jgi:hypothetical protein
MIADELERLATLHRDGSLSDTQYEAAKERVLGGESRFDPEIERQNAVARLDVGWLQVQQSYARGHRGHLPTGSSPHAIYAVIGIVVVASLVGVPTLIRSRSASLEGVLLTLAGIAVVIALLIFDLQRTRRYLRDQRMYEVQRHQILSGPMDWRTIGKTIETDTPVDISPRSESPHGESLPPDAATPTKGMSPIRPFSDIRLP